MASRFLNLLATIPKQTGTCYSAGKYVPNQTSAPLKKSSRSCERYSSRGNSLSNSRFHVRSYSQPTSARKRNFLYETRRDYRETRDEEDADVPERQEYEREEITDESPFYYESTEKDIRRFESAREISPSEAKLREISQRARATESESESIQYELDATRPREPNIVYDIFEHFSQTYSGKTERLLPHLQPSNLKPFGSTNNLVSPTQIKSANVIKYPVIDTHDAHSSNRARKAKERESDDMQRREFSTFKNMSTVNRKENPGYRPVNKMSQFIKSKGKELRDPELQSEFDDISEISSELKACNDIIEKHKNLNAKYQQKYNTKKQISEKKSPESLPTNKYRYNNVSPSVATSTPNIDKRRKFDFGSEKKVKMLEKKWPKIEDLSKKKHLNEEGLPWPEPEVQMPSVVRSSLPINILQTSARPEDSQLLEKIILAPNQKLGAPWPSYSERVMPKKSGGLKIVYPCLPANESLKTMPKTESLHVRDVQKRGISTESKYRLDGGLFSNDCRLRHVLCKKEVVDSIYQKSNAFKQNSCCRKNFSALNSFPPARYSSSSDPCAEKKKKKKRKIICDVSIRKKMPKRKRLPKFIPQDCPCLELHQLKEGNPFRRLKPKPIKQTKQICPKFVTCADQARADDGLKIVDKELPIIIPGECPCVQKLMKDAPPLKRREPREVKEPPTCPPRCIGKECCPPRADKNLKIAKKKLPYLEPSDCPCLEDMPNKDVPLVRLKAKPVKSPPKKICRTEVCDPTQRADADMVIELKDLPKYEPPDCPCIPAAGPTKAPKMKRLQKVFIKSKKCIPVTEEIPCPPRSDKDDWEYVYHYSCYEDEGKSKSKKRKKSKKKNSKRRNRKRSVRRYSTSTRHMDIRQEEAELPKSSANKTAPFSEKELIDLKCRSANNTMTSDILKRADMKFPSSSSSKLGTLWSLNGTRKFSTYNPNLNYVRNEEPECFLRRPISTDNIISAAAALKENKSTQKIACGKEKKKGIKCPKFNLTECPPKARTTCKPKPKELENCTKMETPYPSFSECNEIETTDVLTECPLPTDYLQPSKPLYKPLEKFNIPPPHQGFIDPKKEDTCVRKKLGLAPPAGTSTCSLVCKKFLKQRDYLDQMKKIEEDEECNEKIEAAIDTCCKKNKKKEDTCLEKSDDRCCIGAKKRAPPCEQNEEEKCLEECRKKIREKERVKNMTLWERIVDYFRARPDCPPPEEFKRRMLREKAERAAAKAGLCVYDPKEICDDTKELPKIITAKDCKQSNCKSEKEEEEDDDDLFVDENKCKKVKFSCPKLDESNKTAVKFPKENKRKGGLAEKSDCKDEDEKDTNESSFNQKLKQCLCGSQKRSYSTWRVENLDGSITSNTKNKISKEDIDMSEKIDNLITQGYATVTDPYLCLFKELRGTSIGCLKYLQDNDIETELQDFIDNKRITATYRCEFLKPHKIYSQPLSKHESADQSGRQVLDAQDKQSNCLYKTYLNDENANYGQGRQ